MQAPRVSHSSCGTAHHLTLFTRLGCTPHSSFSARCWATSVRSVRGAMPLYPSAWHRAGAAWRERFPSQPRLTLRKVMRSARPSTSRSTVISSSSSTCKSTSRHITPCWHHSVNSTWRSTSQPWRAPRGRASPRRPMRCLRAHLEGLEQAHANLHAPPLALRHHVHAPRRVNVQHLRGPATRATQCRAERQCARG